MPTHISVTLQYLRSMTCIFCASFLLVGCSYFDTSDHAPLETNASGSNLSGLEGQPVDLEKVIQDSTGGSVQIFSFDDDVSALEGAPAYDPLAQAPTTLSVSSSDVAAVPPTPVMREPIGRVAVYSADPSVQIFPFDDLPPVTSSIASELPPSQPMREEEFVAVNDVNGEKVIVYFNHDSATLGQNALAKLDGVAQRFNTASRGITVEGHASIRANYNDAAQKRVVNLKVSMDRAFAVASALIQRGVPAEAIRVMAWGDTQPARELDGKTEEEAARRVEISS
ncbi:MAG: OmpA family protein [Pseudomonadota bacterium]